MKGLIYKIVSGNTDKIYIGSTTQTLHQRLTNHKRDYKCYLNGKYHYVTSYEILKLGDYRIELIEEIEFIDKKELLKREGYYIQNTKNTVNRIIVRGLDKDFLHREHSSNHYYKYADDINKNILHRDRSIKYYHKNANDINIKRKVKQECYYCNTLLRKSDIARHNKNKKHIEHVKYYIWN